MKKILMLLFLIQLSAYSFAGLKNNVISRSACGLKVIHKNIEITYRHSNFKGNPMPVLFEISELPDSCFIIDNVFLWWTVSYWEKIEEPGVKVTYGNEIKNFKAKITGEGGPKCWVERGTLGYRADITDAINGNGLYYISVETSELETDGLTLLIIYRDLNSKTEGHLYIRDGLITKGDGTNFQDTTQMLDGFKACDDSDSAWGLVIISDIQGADFSYKMIVNGEVKAYQPKFWNSEMMKIEVKKNQTSSLFGVGASGDCYSWVLMGLYFQTSNCKNCFPDKQTYANFKDTLVCQDSEIFIQGFGADKYEWIDEDGKIIGRNRTLKYKATKNTKLLIRGLFNSCGVIEDTLSVRVIRKPAITVLTNPIESACVMAPKRFKVKIRNESEQNEKIEGITIKNGTDFNLISIFNFPFVLVAKSELEIEIEFKPGRIGKISDSMMIEIKNQCQSFYTIELLGEGLINSSFVSLPDTTAIIGTRDFTISLKGRLICDIYDSVFIKYEGIISFENTAFEPEISKSVNIIQSYVQNGHRKLKVSGKIFNINDSISTLAKINGTVLHGSYRTTPLIIEEFRWEDDAISVVKDDGSLTVDACVYELGKIQLLKMLDFNLIPNPANERVKVAISNLSADSSSSNIAKLKVFNIMGERVIQTELITNDHDRIETELDVSSLASGLYNVILETEKGCINRELLIIR